MFWWSKCVQFSSQQASIAGTYTGKGEANTKQLVQYVKEMFYQPTTHNNSNISELTVDSGSLTQNPTLLLSECNSYQGQMM